MRTSGYESIIPKSLGRSVVDLANDSQARKVHVQRFGPRIGYLGAFQIQSAKARQAAQMRQSLIRDASVCQIEPLQMNQTLQVPEPRIADRRFPELKNL